RRAGFSVRTEALGLGVPDVILGHVGEREGSKSRIVHPVAPELSASILIVNVNTLDIAPLTLFARKWHDHHRFFAWFTVKIKIERVRLRGHYHEHEIVWPCALPHSQHFEHVPC